MLHKCMCSAHADNQVKTKEEEKQSAGKDGGGKGGGGGGCYMEKGRGAEKQVSEKKETSV